MKKLKTESLWTPNEENVNESNIKNFISTLNKNFSLTISNYDELYEFSIKSKEKFWSSVWDFTEIIGTKGKVICTNKNSFSNVKWFPESKLNYAENILTHHSNQKALIFNGEHQIHEELTFEQLYSHVSKMVQFLKKINFKKGDRAAILANNAPQTVVCVLAISALGGISSLCSTDFGAQGVIERFEQIEPVLFIYFDSSLYNGKTHSQIEKARIVLKSLPSIRNSIKINYFHNKNKKKEFENEHLYSAILHTYRAKEIPFERVPFSHPLYIVYSSGTTGIPKCIVHGHGGVLLQHKKEHLFHCNIKPTERVFYYTTCGWMMWQWLISALASKATIILYDGSPFYKTHLSLLQYLNDKNISFFGTSAKYIDSLRKLNKNIKEKFSFEKLKTIGSTGSPLIPENFDYVYTKWKENVNLASLSGGTDILSCFVLGCPIKSVKRGEIQCLGLGMQVEVFNDSGHPIIDEPGELVCTAPFPSAPVAFWNDPHGTKYKNAYFERFPNTWCHGDWATITKEKGCIIHGRSDTTLNPGGVRIGTAEIYRQIEQIQDVLESVVTEYFHNGDSKITLFLKMKQDAVFNASIIHSIKEKIKTNCSPRHVPFYIFQVPDIPKTKSGKIMEIAVKNAINQNEIKNIESMQNPECLMYFQNLNYNLDSAVKPRNNNAESENNPAKADGTIETRYKENICP